MPSAEIDREEFKRRFLGQYQDPAFDELTDELASVERAAYEGYSHARKSPRTQKAGAGFADPDYDLSIDWISAREAIRAAQALHDAPAGPDRFLIVNASPRSENTCPGESSKSWRLAQLAREVFDSGENARCEILDLSRVASEYGRSIHPCKACFSTAAALCHWPCSCYPNYSLGQTQDWMNEIYPLWTAAHGIMIVTPVHWYQATSPLKLMMDRLVCADGGNSDPTSTQGKKAELAKALELKGWDYPKHLAGRFYGVVVHGDAEGAVDLRRALADWLSSMELRSAGPLGEVDRYIGYWKPYATSHADLDADAAMQEEVRNAARALMGAVRAARSGDFADPGRGLKSPREK